VAPFQGFAGAPERDGQTPTGAEPLDRSRVVLRRRFLKALRAISRNGVSAQRDESAWLERSKNL
jgi:hypothetical protein